MQMQREEITTWLEAQGHPLDQDSGAVDYLLVHSEEIADDYPDLTADQHWELLDIAYRTMADEFVPAVCAELRTQLEHARAGEAWALTKMKFATGVLIDTNAETQSSLTRLLGVDRMTVRKWLGLR